MYSSIKKKLIMFLKDTVFHNVRPKGKQRNISRFTFTFSFIFVIKFLTTEPIE
jgi:hypothetical protein